MQAKITSPAALFSVIAIALAMTGCAANTTATGSVTTGSVDAVPAEARRGTPVVAGREARVYIMAGFREKDCAALAANVNVSTAPGKGEVTFKPNQTTVIQTSASGKCIGKQITGTGIYYTARRGETGPDTFSILASAGGAPMTKTFKVEVVE